jgi:glycosyltransferase involved in cell wall biosynthesis
MGSSCNRYQIVKWCFYCGGHRPLHVLSGDTRTTGGAEAQVARLAMTMAELGHEVGLIYGDGRGRAERQTIAGVTCIDAAPSWRHPSSLAKFWQALNFLSPDVLYTRLPNDFVWMLGLYAKHRTGAHFIYALAHDLHCSPWTAYNYKRWFHGPVFALGLHSADVIAIQHEHQRTLMSPRLRSKLALVPNLVRSFNDRPRAFGRAKIDAIWVAKIRVEKQLEVFLDLASQLPDLCCAVVGGFDPTVTAQQKACLEERMSSLKNVIFFGPQSAENVMDLLTQSKALVNTSRFEGFPNTMLEAWSAGVPVVSLRVDPGGTIERERLGLVSGSTDRLRSGLMALVECEPLNTELGANGLAYVRRRHSLEAVCEALSQAIPAAPLTPAAPRSDEVTQ